MLSFSHSQFNAVEPMQVDAPTEDNDNTEEEPYIVENPTLVKLITALLVVFYSFNNNSSN